MTAKSKTASELGVKAESAAVLFLITHGFSVLRTNYRTRYGEVDIIFYDGDTLVFAEVKASGKKRSVYMPFKVTITKQRRLIRAAEEYLFRYPAEAENYRFDVILMNFQKPDQWHIEHIKSAFTAD